VMHVDTRVKIRYTAATPAVRKVSGARQNPATLADNTNALGLLLPRLASSRDAHMATTCTLSRLRVDL
jgi:hypothetical protein